MIRNVCTTWRGRVSRTCVASALSTVALFATGAITDASAQSAAHQEQDPDVPAGILRGRTIDKGEFLENRFKQIGLYRGIDGRKPYDPRIRMRAVQQLNLEVSRGVPGPSWQPLGPAPIPNGQTTGTTTPVSGRTIAIAIHPGNPDIVYVGTANGGLYRSTNGGLNWTTLMDQTESLAIGALAIAPSQPDTLYVGTGEQSFSADSFFGVGVYRIDNASTLLPIVSGPFNRNAGNVDVISGRSVSSIQVHPTNPDIIFIGTASGVAGIGGASPSSLPNRGIYRSSNATSSSPVFEKLTGLAGDANASVRDIIIDPANPDLLVANVIAAGGVGGIHVSTNALAVSPTFTQRVVFNSSSTSELTAEFALHNGAGPNPTIYAAVGNLGGRVLVNTDGGTVWTQQVDNNFCSPQCFYDIAIAVDPIDPARVYLGGSPALPFGISTNSGASFTSSSNGLHVDSHVIAVSRSTPSTLYFGSDGGIYKSIDSGATWIPLNNTEFSATQFMGLAVHPLDNQFLIGGTQDNGTNFLQPNATWTRADFGDGGFAGIDQNATDSTNVRMYHTYFNGATLQGYATVGSTAQAGDGLWSFRGCQSGGSTVNGITCNGTVLFYAPLVLGPGSPNTVYYGSDRLYRSADLGVNHTVVSQNPITAGVPISAIGIAANNDNVRVVGLRDGGLFATTTGAGTLVSVDPVAAGSVVPNFYVSRIVIDPNDNNIVYVSLAGFPGAGQSIWKSSNFLSPIPTWSAAANGIPDVPVNVIVLDPDDSTHVYAGSDIGVYHSTDSGATWTSLSNGLPRVPVFGMAFQAPLNPGGKGPLRIATHGRGIWELTSDVIFADGFD
jgi:photosystem II stability/assembly factor-like uncharacterized protein